MHLEKDFVEKVFKTMKAQEEIVPVRLRLERRVKAYVFVLVTAYRLIAALVYFLRESGRNSLIPFQGLGVWISRLGKRKWYLNRKKETLEALKKIGYGKLFNEKKTERN